MLGAGTVWGRVLRVHGKASLEWVMMKVDRWRIAMIKSLTEGTYMISANKEHAEKSLETHG